MKKTRFAAVYFSLALMLLGAAVPRVRADSLHGRMSAVTTVANDSEPSSGLPLRLEENWGILLGEGRDFLRGVEIQVKLPEEAALYRGTYAVFVYRKVTPVPDPNQTSYQGTLLFYKVIEERRQLFIQIPLDSASGFSGAPDTYIHKTPLEPEDFPLVFAILPIMKAIPEQAAQALFHAEVRPLFKNMGKLLVVFSGEGALGQDIKAFIDEKASVLPDGGLLLEPGMHKIRLEKPGYAPFTATVGIDRGKTARVEAVFLKKAASLRVTAPAGTRAFLNGEAVGLETTLPVEPGEHILALKLGDYQMSKRFTVEPGKAYSVSLHLDILINVD
ncbi:MAG: PEGA domain-containing protein [Spirochaetaceae bacterium]|nr:PEGA domain-containing protein [Spirochaetaceae bacterium]